MSTLMTLDQCLAFSDFKTIRVHKATQQASVIDLIRMITEKTSTHASEMLKNLGLDLNRCTNLRINGKGRETPVADARTCVEIIWELPGKAAKDIRRACAHYITRILTGDSSVIVDVQHQLDEINGTKSMMTHTIVDNGVCDSKLHESHLKLASLHQENKPCMQSTQKKRPRCDGISFETKYLEHADILWETVTDRSTTTTSSSYKYVYFVRMQGTSLVKIGYSTDVLYRLAQLQTGNGICLELLYKFKTEAFRQHESALHLHFKMCMFEVSGLSLTNRPIFPVQWRISALKYNNFFFKNLFF
jgi:hypothetical protein